MRRLFCLLLMLSLPLHGFAMQWGTLLSGEHTSVAHEIEHDEGVQHHHDADGVVHYDDSGESTRHMFDHSVTPQPLLSALSLLPGAPEQLVSTVPAHVESHIPDPLLESPLRPPTIALG